MDELAGYAHALAEGVERALPGWVERGVAAVYERQTGTPPPDAVVAAARRAGAEAVAAVMPELRELLDSDIDEQRTTPLAILRSAVVFPERVLEQAGVEPVHRDEQDRVMFPSDVYGLTPASFADIDEGLAELGLAWGAAKAWVHRGRHAPPPRRVLVFAPDLMDRSKIQAAAPAAVIVGTPAELVSLAGPDVVVVVDLSRPGVLDALGPVAAAGSDLIGFGSHVDRDLLDAAHAAGCRRVMARSAFFTRIAELLG